MKSWTQNSIIILLRYLRNHLIQLKYKKKIQYVLFPVLKFFDVKLISLILGLNMLIRNEVWSHVCHVIDVILFGARRKRLTKAYDFATIYLVREWQDGIFTVPCFAIHWVSLETWLRSIVIVGDEKTWHLEQSSSIRFGLFLRFRLQRDFLEIWSSDKESC